MANMSRARLEHASLFYHIKDAVLAKKFSVEVTNEPLSFDTQTTPNGSVPQWYKTVLPGNSAYGGLPTTKGRGWVYFEPKVSKSCVVFDPVSKTYVRAPQQLVDNSFTIPQQSEQSLIVVRDEIGNIIPREQYDIDYKSGRIRYFTPTYPPPSGSSFVMTSGIPTSIDYKFHLVSTLDGWPDDENPPELPFVAVYPEQRMDKPLQVGPGVKYKRRFIIDVFAKNAGQREDLLHAIHAGLYNKRAPVLDLNRTGGPLRQNGTFNDDFLQILTTEGGDQFQTYLTLNPGNGHVLYFINLEVNYNITPRMSRSDIGKFRGRIVVNTETCSDRGIDSVGNLGGNPEPLGGFDSLRLESYSA